jgi:hypothetical protein
MNPKFHGNSPQIIKRSSLYILRRILLRLSRKKECFGFNAAILFPSSGNERNAFSKIEAALELLSRYAPHHIRRIREQIKTIWIFTAKPYTAEWQGDICACVLDHEYVHSEETSAEEIATTIMHEATHARVQLAGVDYEEKLRARIERLCVKSEYWFARRLPNGSELVAIGKSKLSMCDELCVEDDLLTDQAFADREANSLRDLGRDENWLFRTFANAAARIVSKRRARQLSNRLNSKVPANEDN